MMILPRSNSAMASVARLPLASLAAAIALGLGAPAFAADLAAGERLANERCAACHGKDGNTPIDPSYPKLAGQSADYLFEALVDYKNESRKNAIMGGQAKALTRAEMADLAAFYASLPGQLKYKPK